jgi:hypothetical protein
MTLRDAIELVARRLEEDGYVGVPLDPASVVRATSPEGDDGDWRLGFLVVEPDADTVAC